MAFRRKVRVNHSKHSRSTSGTSAILEKICIFAPVRNKTDFLGVTTGNTSKLLYKDWVEQPTEQKPLVLYYEPWVQSQGPVFQQGF